nr:alpha/beta fold hydrolase [Acidobacteriota bacterium]
GTGRRAYLGLHGWGSDRRVFAPLAQHVPAAASFYSADLPGCGSSEPPREWSLDAIVAEIINTVLSIDAGSVTIVGHCGGAIFGMFAAREAVRTVERVVAVDPFAYLPRYFQLFAGKGFGRRAYNATFANPLGRWMTNRALNVGRDSGQTDLTASFSSTDHEVARRYLTLFDSMGGVEEFQGLQAEVDLVYGEKTFGAVRKSVALFSHTLPHSRTLRLEGARHMPLEEATAQLSRIIFAPEEVGEAKQSKAIVQAETEGGRVKV